MVYTYNNISQSSDKVRVEFGSSLGRVWVEFGLRSGSHSGHIWVAFRSRSRCVRVVLGLISGRVRIKFGLSLGQVWVEFGSGLG